MNEENDYKLRIISNCVDLRGDAEFRTNQLILEISKELYFQYSDDFFDLGFNKTLETLGMANDINTIVGLACNYEELEIDKDLNQRIINGVLKKYNKVLLEVLYADKNSSRFYDSEED